MTTKTIFLKKHLTFPFDGVYADVMGEPSTNGIHIVYGDEKNGKTWFALRYAQYLSRFEKTLYVSGEEGLEKEFVDAMRRAKIDHNNKRLLFTEYLELDELMEKLSKRRAPKIVILDNATIYNDQLKNGALRKMLLNYPNVLFVIVAHMEKNEPYTATAKLAKRLAKIIIRVEGLACFISGRCPGGHLIIDEEKATLYHGDSIRKEGKK